MKNSVRTKQAKILRQGAVFKAYDQRYPRLQVVVLEKTPLSVTEIFKAQPPHKSEFNLVHSVLMNRT